LVLHDPTGVAGRAHHEARTAVATRSRRAEHLAALDAARAAAAGRLSAAGVRKDPVGACHAAIDCLKACVDRALVLGGVAPGGQRALARLRPVDPALADAVVALEAGRLPARDGEAGPELRDMLSDPSPFFAALEAQAAWLYAHGMAADGRHALWCTLGAWIEFVLPGRPAGARARAARLCKGWLALTGWEPAGLPQRVAACHAVADPPSDTP
jgi:hypothetical protein